MIKYILSVDASDCCGCRACEHVCAHHAIQMKPNEEGFLYPSVDIMKCIGCNLCDKTCPFLNPFKKNILKECYEVLFENYDIILEMGLPLNDYDYMVLDEIYEDIYNE